MKIPSLGEIKALAISLLPEIKPATEEETHAAITTEIALGNITDPTNAKVNEALHSSVVRTATPTLREAMRTSNNTGRKIGAHTSNTAHNNKT